MRTLDLAAQSTETILIDKAVKGDLDAFNQLVLTYQDMAYNHARALLSDHASAEDTAQQSFIKAFQNIKGFRGGSFRGWLLKIVTNSAYDMLRQAHRHPTQPLFRVDEGGEDIESAAWLVDPNVSIQSIVEENELSKDIHKVLDELPDVYRSVLTLIDVHDLDYTEAAQALNVPIGTVKSRLARARLRMKEKLGSSLNYLVDEFQFAAANCG